MKGLSTEAARAKIVHMFETAPAPEGELQPLHAVDVRCGAERLATLGAGSGAGADEGELVDQIAALEHLKRAASAAQARVTAAFAASRVAAAEAAGVPRDRRSRGVAEMVALARGESPHRGGRHLGLATALVAEMPNTLAALAGGAIDEWAATLLVRESAVLSAPERSVLDARIAPLLAAPGTGTARLARAAHGIVCELDPAAVAARASKAAAERRVSIRPAPDTMTYLTALLPVAEGVAVYAALDGAARTAAAAGDPRGRGQVMADTLTGRCTGLATGEPVQVAVQLVMTDTTLLGGGPGAATVHAAGGVHGPVPAPLARALVVAAADRDAAWVRRLYTAPRTGALVAVESRHRRFPPGLRQLITLRDQTCATPWCDAPIRHVDHITAHTDGGPTTATNAQGLCEHCNLVKQTPGWATTGTAGRTTITTPTGHTYPGTSPPALTAPPQSAPGDPDPSPLERALRHHLDLHLAA